MRTTTHHLCLAAALLSVAVTAQSATNWFAGLLTTGVAQTTVVRHSVDRNRFYLCWTDGATRHGLRFSRANLDRNLRNVVPGKRVPLSSLFQASNTTWTAEDEKTCWGGA
jgi:hypothetical protein